MKPFLIFNFDLLIAGLLLCGCAKAQVHESNEQLVQDKLTNDIVGYSRTISIAENFAAETNGPQAVIWGRINPKYDVTAEYINESGGVSRTNLVYRIITFDLTNVIDGTARKITAAEMDPEWQAWLMEEQYQEFLAGLSNKYPAVNGK